MNFSYGASMLRRKILANITKMMPFRCKIYPSDDTTRRTRSPPPSTTSPTGVALCDAESNTKYRIHRFYFMGHYSRSSVGFISPPSPTQSLNRHRLLFPTRATSRPSPKSLLPDRTSSSRSAVLQAIAAVWSATRRVRL